MSKPDTGLINNPKSMKERRLWYTVILAVMFPTVVLHLVKESQFLNESRPLVEATNTTQASKQKLEESVTNLLVQLNELKKNDSEGKPHTLGGDSRTVIYRHNEHVSNTKHHDEAGLQADGKGQPQMKNLPALQELKKNISETTRQTFEADYEAINTTTGTPARKENNLTIGDEIPKGLKSVQVKPKEDHLASCIMFMDDNHFLIEWLAYHWYVGPVRRVIIAVDEKSKTSPESVVNRWKDRMNITIWNNTDVYRHGGHPRGKNSEARFLQHQEAFLRECMMTLKEEGHSWTILTDPDEYTMVNPRARDPKDPMYRFNTTIVEVPSQGEPGSILKMLHIGFSTPRSNKTSKYFNYHPCVTISRKHFGAKEMANHNPNTTGYHLFNTSHFQTHRWHYGAQGNTHTKQILDLSRVGMGVLKQTGVNPHRPVKMVCSKASVWFLDSVTAFAAYHYSGTLDQVLFRSNDNRIDNKNGATGVNYRTQRYYAEKETYTTHQQPQDIEDWLDGFISTVGEAEARRLLEHVGKPNEAASLSIAS